MAFKTIEWDRETLYEQIRSAPLRTAAKQYGISDVGLAKVCKKLEIPRPGRGHWRRQECGHKVGCPPLPALTRRIGHVSRIHMPQPEPETPPEPALPPLKAPRDVKTPHPLLWQTKRAYKKGSKARERLVGLQRVNDALSTYILRVVGHDEAAEPKADWREHLRNLVDHARVHGVKQWRIPLSCLVSCWEPAEVRLDPTQDRTRDTLHLSPEPFRRTAEELAAEYKRAVKALKPDEPHSKKT